jgi:fatty-acyl-CoA synthase
VLGAVPVAMDPGMAAERVVARVAGIGARVVVAEEGVLAGIEAAAAPSGRPRLEFVSVARQDIARYPNSATPAAPRPEPDDLAYLQLTSGSTGEPRAVAIRHASLLASLASIARRMEVRPALGAAPGAGDVFVGCAPLHYATGLVRFVLGPLTLGCPAHLVEPGAAAGPRWLEAIERAGGTITSAPDFVFRAAARATGGRAPDLRTLRFAGSGGEPVRADTIEAFESRFGLPGVIRPGYGLAEATLTVAVLAPGEPRRLDAAGAPSCGRALDALEVRVERDDGSTAAPDEQGEVVVRGAPVFAGYFGDAAGTAEALRGGALRTGDAGALDADGHLYVAGRRRGLLKRGGATVAPRELEEAAERVAGVERAAAIAVPPRHAGGGNDVALLAEVAAALAASAPERRRALAAELAAAVARAAGVAPRDVVLLAPGAIPRTSSGKLKHEELRALHLAGELERRGAVVFGAR